MNSSRLAWHIQIQSAVIYRIIFNTAHSEWCLVKMLFLLLKLST